jgi:hypothetical protein
MGEPLIRLGEPLSAQASRRRKHPVTSVGLASFLIAGRAIRLDLARDVG